MKLYIASDHAGVKMKCEIVKYLEKKGIDYEDLGSFNPENHDDYPDYAFTLAKKVVKNKGKGVLICGTGTGMVIAANKVKGVRAALAYDDYSAKMAKHDNDVNILCLRGRKFSLSKAKKILNKWLNTKFSGLSRHKRRIDKIKKYEK